MIELEQARELLYDRSDLELLIFVHDKHTVVQEYIAGHRPHLKEIVRVLSQFPLSNVHNVLMSKDFTHGFFSRVKNKNVVDLCNAMIGVLQHRENRQSEDLRFLYLVALWLSCTDEDQLCTGIVNLLRETCEEFIYEELSAGYIFYTENSDHEFAYVQNLGILGINKNIGRLGGRVCGMRDIWRHISNSQPLAYSADVDEPVSSSVIVRVAQQIFVHVPDVYVRRHNLLRHNTSLANRPVV